jgi:hypothetical protein
MKPVTYNIIQYQFLWPLSKHITDVPLRTIATHAWIQIIIIIIIINVNSGNHISEHETFLYENVCLILALITKSVK